MFKQVKYILITFLLLSTKVFAQTSYKPDYSITARIHRGYVLDFSSEVAHLANQHLWGFELDVSKNTRGEKQWQQILKFPKVGYSLYYFSFDNSKPLGNTLSLVIHLSKPFFKTKRSELSWRIGIGPGYVDKVFDAQNNYRDNVLSTHLNYTLNGNLDYNFKITRTLLLNAGISLVHISNGNIKKPNFGINIPTIHFGITYKLSDNETLKRDSLPIFKRKTYFHLSVAGGLKDAYPVNGPRYFTSSVAAYVERRVNRKSGLNAGIDLFYDASKKHSISYDTMNINNTFINYTQVGIVGGHELYINKLTLLTQFGVYLFDPLHLNKAVYQRFGLKYYFNEKLFAQMSLKTHLGVADWVEWGIGIRL